jgi:hypothetical protein
MQKLQAEQNYHQEKVSGLIVLLLVIVVGLLTAGRVFMANRLVETSQTLKNLDLEIIKLEAENEILAKDLRAQESMTIVEKKVTALGFIPAKVTAHLIGPAKVAFKLP